MQLESRIPAMKIPEIFSLLRGTVSSRLDDGSKIVERRALI
jgi:hypothetical protein